MLSRIPLSLRLITTLTHFSCDNNPLEWPPAQVCMRGMNHVFKFLHEIEKYGNDPQQFASNRDESLLRRRSNRSKKASRPISDASTLSGSGSEYGERSFIDEMTNFVQSAFGDNDTKIFQVSIAQQTTHICQLTNAVNVLLLVVYSIAFISFRKIRQIFVKF
jgi:hypothetical protein